jgi:hypothetical protein
MAQARQLDVSSPIRASNLRTAVLEGRVPMYGWPFRPEKRQMV